MAAHDQPQETENIQERFLSLVVSAVRRLADPNDEVGDTVRGYLYQRGLLPPTWQRALLGAAEVYDPKAGKKTPCGCDPLL